MKINYFILLILIFILFESFSICAISEKDVSVEILLDDNLESGIEYEKFILLTNLDDISGIDDNLLNNVYWFLEGKENNFFLDFYVSKKINSYSSSGMGSFILNEYGEYILCVNITPTNFLDYDLNNNYACKPVFVDYEIDYELNNTMNETINFTINNTINETANISVNVTVNNTINLSINNTVNNTENLTMNNTINITINETENETSCVCALSLDLSSEIINADHYLTFEIDDCNRGSTLLYPVTYWIETLNGDVVKNKIETTSKSSKKYTPSFENEKALIVNAKNDCDSINKLFVYKGDGETYSNPFIDISFPDIITDNLFFVELTGYKDSTSKTVVYLNVVQNEKIISETSKFYVLNKNTDFKVRLPIIMKSAAKNEYAELVVEGLDFYEREKIIIDLPSNLKDKINPFEQTNSKIDSVNSKILSFYTRKIYFEESILVYIRTDNAQDCELKVYTTNFSEIKYVNQTLMTYSVNISTPKELITAELNCNQEIYSKSLLLDLKINEDNKNIKDEENNTKNDENELNSALLQMNNKNNNLLTGNAVINNIQKNLSNSNEESKTNSMENNNLLIPMILGTIGVLILFRKEIFTALKKLKLFKLK